MSIKPMLFNTDMVRALMEGRKTVTRRVVKEPYYIDEADACIGSGLAMHRGVNATHEMPYPDRPYEPGDILYVRETFGKATDLFGEFPQYIYRAGFTDAEINEARGKGFCWHPSIHMPKEAARIFLRVTDVRVERLQSSFTEPICPILELWAEGVDIGETCRQCIENYGEPCCVDTVDEDGTRISECGILDEIRGDFSDLWDSTIKPADVEKYGWAENPWVWVIEFERADKPEGWPDMEG